MATEKEKLDLAEKVLDLAKNTTREYQLHKKYFDAEVESLGKINSLYDDVNRLISRRNDAMTKANSQELKSSMAKLKTQIEERKIRISNIKLNQEGAVAQMRAIQKEHDANVRKSKMDGAFSEYWKERVRFSERALSSIEDEVEYLGQLRRGEEDYLEIIKKQLKSEEGILENSESEVVSLNNQITAAKENLRWAVRFHEIQDKIKKVGETLTSPYLILTGLLALSYKRFVELDAAAKSFRDTTKFTKDQTVGLDKEVERISNRYTYMGVQSKDVYDAAASLTDEYGLMNTQIMENAESVTLMAKNLGVTNKNAAGFVSYMDRVGGMSKEQIVNMTGFTKQLSKASGVPLDKIMEDVASASDEAKAMTGGNVINLVKASAQARMLGTNLNAVAQASRGLLNFNESINSELEASVLLGKNLSFMDARRKAFARDLAGAQEETLKQVEKMGDFNSLNVLQQEALAKASGYSISDLQKMIKQKKDYNALTAEQKADYQKLMDMKKKDAENNNLAADELKKMQMQSTMDALGASMDQLKLFGAQILLPLVKVLSHVAKAFSYISDKVGVLTEALGASGDSFVGITGRVVALVGSFYLLKKAIFGSVGMLGKFGGEFGKKISEKLLPKSSGGGIIGKLKGLFGGGKGKEIEGLSSAAEKTKPEAGKRFAEFMKNLGEGIKALSSTGKTVFLDIVSGIVDGIKQLLGLLPKAADVLSRSVSSLVSGISKGILELSKTLKSVFGDIVSIVVDSASRLLTILPKIGDALGSGFSNLMKGLATGISYLAKPQVFMGALAIAALGVAIIPFAYSMKMFNDIQWDKVLIGLGALATFATAAGLIGGPFVANIALGSVAIALLGAAIIPFAYSMDLLGGVKWDGVWVGLGALTAFSAMAGLLSFAAPFMVAGSIGIAALGLALIPFSSSMETLGNVKWDSVNAGLESIEKAGDSLAGMVKYAPIIATGSASFALLGIALTPFTIVMTQFSSIDWKSTELGIKTLMKLSAAAAVVGKDAGSIILGSAALVALSFALVPMSAALSMSSGVLSEVVPKLSELASISGSLFETAKAITALGGAFAAFGAGQAAGGLLSFVGNLLGGDKVDELKKLAELGPQLKVTTDAVTKISNPSINREDSSENSPSNSTEQIVKKLDELIGLMKNGGIAVNLDGRRVSDGLALSLNNNS